MLKFRICWYIFCVCSKLHMWSWPGQFWKLLCLTLCGRNNIMTLLGLHTIYSAEYVNKYFPGLKHVCVQFSLCKMDIIILFFPNALSVLFVYKFLDRRAVFCICLGISNTIENWHHVGLEIQLWYKWLQMLRQVLFQVASLKEDIVKPRMYRLYKIY